MTSEDHAWVRTRQNGIWMLATLVKRLAQSRYAGVSSFIAGIFSPIPLVGILGIVLGVAALRSKTRQIGTEVLACLGILFSMGGAAFGTYVIYGMVSRTGPIHVAADALLQDLLAQRTTAALAKCDPGITRDEIESLEDDLQSLGAPVKTDWTSSIYQSFPRGTQRRYAYEIDATITGPTGKTLHLAFALIEAHGGYKVWAIE